jgi:uncharacterized protein involved in exopolysaccharide biosynthesis
MLKKKVTKYRQNLELADKENQSLNMEKDHTIQQMKSTFITKMEQLQTEVEHMKAKQSQKSASYKKIKHEYTKLRSKSKYEQSIIHKFVGKFDNDIAFARN